MTYLTPNSSGSDIGVLVEADNLKVICGNDKLMERYAVDLEFNNFRMNM